MKRLLEWLNSRRALRAACKAYRDKYPEQRWPSSPNVHRADSDGFTVIVWYGKRIPPFRSWWHVKRADFAATEIQEPYDIQPFR